MKRKPGRKKMPQTKNVSITPGGTRPVIHVSQNDVGRAIAINVSDGADWYDLSGQTVKLVGTKPSGLGYSVTATVAGHTATIVTTKQMTDEAGQIESEIRVTSGNTVIGTANIVLDVERDPHPEGVTDGSVDTLIPELTVLVERVEAAADSIHDLSVEATTLNSNQSATATYDEELNKITFGIPRGQAGTAMLICTDPNSDGNVIMETT